MLRNVRLWEQSEIRFSLNFETGFVVGAGLISRLSGSGLTRPSHATTTNFHENHRDLLHHYYGDQCIQRKTAIRLGLSPGTVRNYLRRAAEAGTSYLCPLLTTW